MPEGIMKPGDLLQTDDPIRVPRRMGAGIVLQALFARIVKRELPLTPAKAATESRCPRVSIISRPQLDEPQARVTHHPGPPHDRPQLPERMELVGVGDCQGSARASVSPSRRCGGSGHQQLIQLAHIVSPFAAGAHDGGVELFAHRLQLNLFLVICEVEEIL